ncbi:hypothetical protein [Bradyrhizobium sp. ARR65]|uniref:hypothetical protein n=1 Tax=Bradyrhizobium sp. ARR65 TaxID=1040989 RepID=UPI0004670A8E|nr:hypothetical protein [Bradyrhizobium sp. ARR65]
MYALSNFVRPKGDPTIIRSGPGSLTSTDRLARALGWFSIGVGAIELLAPHRVTRALGMRGREGLVRVYGLREISSGVMSLSVDKKAGLWSRVAGDGMDIATLLPELRISNPRKGNVALALLMVGGIMVLDYIGAQDAAAQQRRGRGNLRLYNNRSGFPKGLEASKGLARQLPQGAAMGAS